MKETPAISGNSDELVSKTFFCGDLCKVSLFDFGLPLWYGLGYRSFQRTLCGGCLGFAVCSCCLGFAVCICVLWPITILCMHGSVASFATYVPMDPCGGWWLQSDLLQSANA